MNGGTCIDGVNNYTCICLSGYTGDTCDMGECLQSFHKQINIFNFSSLALDMNYHLSLI